jgi:hypothetical protein
MYGVCKSPDGDCRALEVRGPGTPYSHISVPLLATIVCTNVYRPCKQQ